MKPVIRNNSANPVYRPKPVWHLPRRALRPRWQGWATDVDHTLTDRRGNLCAYALRGVERATAQGVEVVPVTGRSAGYGHVLHPLFKNVRLFVAENGFSHTFIDAPGALPQTFVLRPNKEGSFESVPWTAEIDQSLATNRQALMDIYLTQLVPKFGDRLELSDDYRHRMVEITLNLREGNADIRDDEIRSIHDAYRSRGYLSTHSSIHFHAWAKENDHNKLDGFLVALRDRLGLIDFAQVARQWIFTGDSGNDGPMFGYFNKVERAIGVRNVEKSLPKLIQYDQAPNFITQRGYGRGSRQVAEYLLARNKVNAHLEIGPRLVYFFFGALGA